VGGILGTALLFLIGILVFSLGRRKASSDRMGESPEIPVAMDYGRAQRELVGGALRNEGAHPVGGGFQYDGVLNEDGRLQSDD
jgi:hypothetical protein